MIGKVLLGAPELGRLGKGEKLTVNVVAGTTAIEIRLSTIALGQLKKPNATDELLEKLLGNKAGCR